MGMQLDQVQQFNNDNKNNVGGGRRVGVSVNFVNSNLVLYGDVLIGADGVLSQIRTQQILKFPPAVPTGLFTWQGQGIHVTNISALQHLLDITGCWFLPQINPMLERRSVVNKTSGTRN